jgi:hypothetical protein
MRESHAKSVRVGMSAFCRSSYKTRKEEMKKWDGNGRQARSGDEKLRYSQCLVAVLSFSDAGYCLTLVVYMVCVSSSLLMCHLCCLGTSLHGCSICVGTPCRDHSIAELTFNNYQFAN